MKDGDSCLRIRERAEDWQNRGSVASCTVENICQKRVQYKLATTTPLSNCGRFVPGLRSIQPGEEQTKEGFSSCCVLSEKHDDNVMQTEPGGCVEAAADVTMFGLDAGKDCVIQNTCGYAIELYTNAPSNMRSYFTLPAKGGWTTLNGVGAARCKAKTMRSARQE